MPVSLKLFLTALAILDDLGAVAIIAVFYKGDLQLSMLAGAGVTLLLLIILNLTGWERRLWAYLGLGLVLWYFVFQSGVHATIAGVALACVIPLRRTPGRLEAAESPLIRLEHALHPWVAFAVVPVFGFANAGVSFLGLSGSALFGPVPLSTAAGLFLGKQLGIFTFAWAAIRANLADLPTNATWAQLYGIAVLCGIGFTMSLLIGLLAFPTSAADQDFLDTLEDRWRGSWRIALFRARGLVDYGRGRRNVLLRHRGAGKQRGRVAFVAGLGVEDANVLC